MCERDGMENLMEIMALMVEIVRIFEFMRVPLLFHICIYMCSNHDILFLLLFLCSKWLTVLIVTESVMIRFLY